MKKILWMITCILLVAVTLSGCSNKEFPTGTYTRQALTVEYRDDGSYTLMGGNEIITEGTYVIQDDEIQFTDSYCAEEYANPGIYNWKYDDGKLNFELVEDFCEGRRGSLTLTWFGPK